MTDHEDAAEGLAQDLPTLLSRRTLGLFGGAGVTAALAACTAASCAATSGPASATTAARPRACR